MRKLLSENKDFYIISRSIDNASACKVTEINENCFKVKLSKPLKYEKDESVELFSKTDKGQIYFETLVKEVDNDTLSIWFPLSFKYLQRRQYTRIKTDLNTELLFEGKNIQAKVLDLSAGGLKVYTDCPLTLLNNYNLKITIDNKELKTGFNPIRIETFESGFISSGKFVNISNFDKVTLVQYCLRKYIENSIK